MVKVLTQLSLRHVTLLGTSLLGSAFVLMMDEGRAATTQSVPVQHKQAHATPTSRKATSRPAPKAPVEVSGGSEAVVVTGTREFGKKARDSIAPVDIVTNRQLTGTGQPTLRDSLALLLPSLTVPTGGFDAGALTDTISLRGLNPNETLVLVDGKRRHTTANIYADGGPAQGSTPVDIDMIPMSMIDHIEVLRDGASAQYGSDAIAGVVNIILKKQNHGLTMRSNTGITSEGDGFQQGVFIDGGLNLNNRGFVHIGGDFVHQDHTVRSGADNRTNTYVNQLLGQPEQTRESVAINAGYDITDNVQAYASATYAHRHAESYQNYRLASTLAKYPGYAAIYPYGYAPIEALNEDDYELTAGFKGTLAGWHWDVSSVFGRDYDAFDTESSTNVGLYTATGQTPTSFAAQSYNDTQWTNSVDLSRKFRTSFWPYAINVAGGASYRYEAYAIGTGSPASYTYSSSDGFPGTNPANAGKWSRDVAAGYLDISTNLMKHWQIDLAGRVEHYTDVGNTKTGKISTRYDFSPRFAIRGTFSNGFHAPTLAQEHYSALSVSPTAASGIIAANSAGALANGASALKPESSTSAEGGIIVEPIKKLHVTVDVYQIDLRDRIMPGGTIYGSQAYSALQTDGFNLPAGSENWTGSQLATHWFANVANTRTQGLDLTATYPTDFGRYGHADWDVAINLNRTRLRHQATSTTGAALLNAQYVAYLTTAYPRSKIIFGGTWRSARNKWAVSVHEIRYGETTSQLTYYTGPYTYSTSHFLEFQNVPKWTTNASVTYNITPKWSATIGGNNIFAKFPSVVPEGNRYLGVPKYYMSTSQLGMNGGYYYLDVSARF
ncbi:TonB-dependent outer membrane receptor [Gluconobacter oxydans 621H]|uniref:TonB-dependent outer membrane receptor n=2 Tax=Gluconobacter oxydans TaxID=442 RepID=Q5FTV8_GLUOX|nr:TonB-dependent outer membrane receptor [Gluconobacter oxydans 621H]TCW28436.1 iron complex outermembrane receptor protein [Gluconobacter oxydans]